MISIINKIDRPVPSQGRVVLDYVQYNFFNTYCYLVCYLIPRGNCTLISNIKVLS